MLNMCDTANQLTKSAYSRRIVDMYVYIYIYTYT